MSRYVLGEANESHGGGDTGEPVAKVPVEGGEEATNARAEEMSRTSLSGDLPEEEGCLVFRTSPTSRLVEKPRSVRHERSADPTKHTPHLRICVAELVLAREPDHPPRSVGYAGERRLRGRRRRPRRAARVPAAPVRHHRKTARRDL
ncbi:hypothetical protein [Streptomyces sp. TLI_105]|uniref:hypothetical protein n=1 Tax=Streptomyces sp. TLI_105 TaxID=1881019 RepID=UPI00115F7C4D|nr:hypothetical protein [Streptomyces sp. TLI_105]